MSEPHLPQRIANRIEVLILQHPQERAEALGTAGLTVASLAHATLRVGLSWPGLGRALDRPPGTPPDDPKRWGVLYLGSAKPAELLPAAELIALDRKGKAVAEQARVLTSLQGVVLLDGTWSQAKALWWRNAWLLKLQRLVLAPVRQSRYGKLRREPRRESLSTLEAAALVLSRLEHRPEIETQLAEAFETLLRQHGG